MNKLLTIVIPTYNRERQLIRLLNSIERQKCIEKYSIVILNNHSDYDVEASIRFLFPGDFFDNIDIYNRPYNAGGDYNIGSSFLFAKSPYLWIIGDDDEVLDGCFDIIYDDIHHYPDVPCFKYHIEGHSTYDDDVLINTISQFKDLYKKNFFSAGDIIFMSNNIFNLPKMGDYVSSALYYSYCSVPHSLPMLRCMIDEKNFLLSHREIVKYNAPNGDHWNYIKISTSLSTVLDINYGNKYYVVKDFFQIISNHFDIHLFLEECLKIESRNYRKYVCKKALMTLFERKPCSKYFCYSLYQIESTFGIKVFSLHLKVITHYRESLRKVKEHMKESNHIIYRVYKMAKESNLKKKMPR